MNMPGRLWHRGDYGTRPPHAVRTTSPERPNQSAGGQAQLKAFLSGLLNAVGRLGVRYLPFRQIPHVVVREESS